MGIRFGRVDPETSEVDWIYKPHDEFDGIGGFGSILRDRGIVLESLPQKSYPPHNSWRALFRAIPQLVSPPKVLPWGADIMETSAPDEPTLDSPKAVAWHVYSEAETDKIKVASRQFGVTVNSLLLKHLTDAIRPFLDDPLESVPWMIPVNLRGGGVVQQSDMGNHSSYVAVKIAPDDSAQNVHRGIYEKMGREQHWANWKTYEVTRSLPELVKKNLIETNRAMLQWNIGSFSNLGVWDPDKEIKDPYCRAAWLFAPPVLRCQLIGAGCITFQGQLSIMLHVHPALTVSDEIVSEWMKSWVKQIDLEMAGVDALN